MNKDKRPVLFMLLFAGFILLLVLIMQPLEVFHFRQYIAVLFPKGIIALEERNLLFIIQAIMLLVILPVYILTFAFSWRYRAHNTQAKYDPDLIDNKFAEVIWWGVPFIVTVVVSVFTWVKTHELDPYKPIVSDTEPLKIQVVALQWKWLFIYPAEKIATVNFLPLPVHTPIHFEITADAPMNSFWIPHLGGQIYAMPNMKTELYLIADEAGDFRGSSANISGEGFAGMHFITHATAPDEYQQWVKEAQAAAQTLNWPEYKQLAAPSKDHPVATYQLADAMLFEQVVTQYMHPQVK